jgi:hypothetical protein
VTADGLICACGNEVSPISKYDRFNLTTLRKCDVSTAMARLQIAANGDRLSCSTCNAKLEYLAGRWTTASDEFAHDEEANSGVQ